MGFSPFKKSDKDSSEARTPTPPEYDNSNAVHRLPSVAREELEGLTLYEKKCVLINREIDNNGCADSDILLISSGHKPSV
jgi:hypothetical protein